MPVADYICHDIIRALFTLVAIDAFDPAQTCQAKYSGIFKDQPKGWDRTQQVQPAALIGEIIGFPLCRFQVDKEIKKAQEKLEED